MIKEITRFCERQSILSSIELPFQVCHLPAASPPHSLFPTCKLPVLLASENSGSASTHLSANISYCMLYLAKRMYSSQCTQCRNIFMQEIYPNNIDCGGGESTRSNGTADIAINTLDPCNL